MTYPIARPASEWKLEERKCQSSDGLTVDFVATASVVHNAK